jgi:hypothetical protein
MTILKVINTAPMPGNKIAPPLTLGEAVRFRKMHICKCGERHYDVGLSSEVNSVTCYKCREELPDGDEIHWAHSSRFEVVAGITP